MRPFKGTNFIRYQVLALSLFLQSLAVLQHRLIRDDPAFPPAWNLEITVLILASICLTILALPVRSTARRSAILGLRFLFVYIASMVAGTQAFMTASLLSAFLLDAVFTVTYPYCILVAAGALAVEASIPLVNLATSWEAVVGRLRMRDVASIVGYAGAAASVALMARSSAEEAAENRRTVARLNESVDSLIDVASGYRQYIKKAEEESMTQERNRIIGEIHDSIGFTLTTVLMLSEMVQEKLSKDGGSRELAEAVAGIHDTAKQGLTNVRISLRILKVKSRDEANDLSNIRKLVLAFGQVTGIRTRIEFSNAPLDFPAGMRDTVFRLIQECMVNSFRHGHATEIRIYLFQDLGTLHVSVNDNGTGCGDVQEGLGLSGIKENVARLHGSIRYTSQRNMGFGVSVAIPTGREEKSDAAD
jgi:signal transduction histidine kinase